MHPIPSALAFALVLTACNQAPPAEPSPDPTATPATTEAADVDWGGTFENLPACAR